MTPVPCVTFNTHWARTCPRGQVDASGSYVIGTVQPVPAGGSCVVRLRRLTEAWGCNAPNHAPFGTTTRAPRADGPLQIRSFVDTLSCTTLG